MSEVIYTNGKSPIYFAYRFIFKNFLLITKNSLLTISMATVVLAVSQSYLYSDYVELFDDTVRTIFISILSFRWIRLILANQEWRETSIVNNFPIFISYSFRFLFLFHFILIIFSSIRFISTGYFPEIGSYLLVIAVVFWIIIAPRLIVTLPASATGRDASMALSWRRTEKHSFRILFDLLILMAPIEVVKMLVFLIFSKIEVLMMQFLFSSLAILVIVPIESALYAAYLSKVYQRCEKLGEKPNLDI